MVWSQYSPGYHKYPVQGQVLEKQAKNQDVLPFDVFSVPLSFYKLFDTQGTL